MSKQISQDKIAEFVQRFLENKDVYRSYGEEVANQIEERAQEQGFHVETSSRVKTSGSLKDKIARKNYGDPNEVEDLVGVRVICVFSDDFDKVEHIIREDFEVLSKEDKKEDLKSDRMGYQSRHFIVSTRNSTTQWSRMKKFESLKCEIQVRTALQHAWAIASHDMFYKAEDEFPRKIKRKLNLASSTIELVQDVIDSISSMKQKYVDELSEYVQEKNDDLFLLELNRETFEAYLSWKFPDMPMSRKVNDRIISCARYAQVEKVKDVDEIYERVKESVARYEKENPEVFKYSSDYISKALIFDQPDFRRAHGCAPETRLAAERYSRGEL